MFLRIIRAADPKGPILPLRHRLAWPLALLLALAATLPAAAQAQRAFVQIETRDIDAAERWYRRVFALRAVNRFDRPCFDQRILAGPELILELVQSRPPRGPAPAAQAGIGKVGIEIADFDRRLAAWRAAGLAPSGGLFFDEALALATVLLRDPDGNIVQIFGRSDGPFEARVGISPDFRRDPDG